MEMHIDSAKTRAQQPSASAADEDVAEAIARILEGSVVLSAGLTPLSLIALLLGRLTGPPDSSVTEAVARLILRDVPTIPDSQGATRAAYRANVRFRALYAVNAVRRIAERVSDGEALGAALEGERPNLASHLDASRERVAGAKMNDAAVEKWGNILGWYDTGRAATHTPEHKRADGNNFDVLNPPRQTDGYLPAQRFNCDCVPGPPHPNGRMLS